MDTVLDLDGQVLVVDSDGGHWVPPTSVDHCLRIPRCRRSFSRISGTRLTPCYANDES